MGMRFLPLSLLNFPILPVLLQLLAIRPPPGPAFYLRAVDPIRGGLSARLCTKHLLDGGQSRVLGEAPRGGGAKARSALRGRFEEGGLSPTPPYS